MTHLRRQLLIFSPMIDGSAYLASSSTGATYQTGQDIVVRQQFVSNGKLANTEDTNFRAVSNDWPVFGIAHDLGTVSSTASAPAVFVVGHARDPAIQYITAGGVLQSRSSYFWSTYSSAAAAVCFSVVVFVDFLLTAFPDRSLLSSVTTARL